MAWGTPDVYYQPEAFGLEKLIEADDPDACYSFDIFVVWRHVETGYLYYGQDSGCSCPSPFEEFNSLDDLTKLDDWEAFCADVDGWCDYTDRGSERLRDEVAMSRHEIKMAAGKALDR